MMYCLEHDYLSISQVSLLIEPFSLLPMTIWVRRRYLIPSETWGLAL